MAFPTTGILDNFNRADEGPPPSANWGNGFVEGLSVIDHECGGIDSGNNSAYWLTPFNADSEVYLTVSVVSDEIIAIFLRASNNTLTAANYIYLSYTQSPGTFVIGVAVNGTDVANDAIVYDLVNGDSFGLQADGDAITGWVKPAGGSWTQILALTSSAVMDAGYTFLMVADTTGRVIDFGGGTIVVPPTPPEPGEGGTASAEFVLNGSTVDLIDDMRATTPIVVTYGINGSGPTDRVANTGTMTFALDNSEHNSAGLLGYYAPGNANCRAGFEVGVPCSLAIRYNGVTYVKFVGTLETIEPDSGQYLNRATHCQAVDWMDEAAKQKIRLLPTQTDKRGNDLMGTIVAAMATQPTGTSYATGDSVFPYSLDNSRDEKSSPMSEFQRIAMSELGYVFIKGHQNVGGILTFQARSSRARLLASSATLDDAGPGPAMTEMKVTRKRSAVYNRIKITTHPRRLDAVGAETVLFELTSKPKVGTGKPLTALGQYRDPTQKSVRCGGLDMIAPVATTDYAMNTIADGSGTDLTSSFTVVAHYGGNGVELIITNNSGTDGYVTKLQCRGRGVYDDNAMVSEASDAASIAAYGENVLSIDMPMQDNQFVGQDAADYLLAMYKDPLTAIDSIEFVGNSSVELMTAGLALEPGDRVTIAETATGVAGDYVINGVTVTISAPSIYHFAWTVAPMAQFEAAGLWLIGIETRSEIGETTRVGY